MTPPISTTVESPAALVPRLRALAQALEIPQTVLTPVLNAPVERADWFSVLEWLVPRRNKLAAAPARELTGVLEALLRFKAYSYPPPGREGKVEPVVFGTGGHRGEIGVGLTLLHVHVIVTALINNIAGMSPTGRAGHFGAADLAEVRRRGIVLGHDNRLLNPELSFYAAHLLRQAGFAVRYAGRVASPQLSLLVPRLGWAAALNFTPSHNPFRYGGVKLNPADGGLAGSDLTDPLAQEANRLLAGLKPAEWPAPAQLAAAIAAEEARIERVDPHEPYLDMLNDHPVLRLKDLAGEIKALGGGRTLSYVADPVWGAAVPVYLALQRRLGTEVLTVLHTEEDPYFGGQTTEPNEHTLGDAQTALRGAKAEFRVGIRNDPDSDRGLVGDEKTAVKMNKFAALALRYLMDLGYTGDLVTTLPTSHFGPDYARARGLKVVITPTGFKNFRPHLAGGAGLLAYEESDGMTLRGHTLDKDGVIAGLLAVRMVLHYRKSLGALLAELEREMGDYHWLQDTFMIDMSAAKAKERLKRLESVRPGEVIEAAGHRRVIKEVNTQDGYKFILDDGTWVMMRPSGTEPKVRVYAETQESEAATHALCEAGRALALKAIQQG